MDNILTRIQKLLALTESRGATPDEAASAAAKVQALLFAHNLSMADVEQHAAEPPDDMGREDVEAAGPVICAGFTGTLLQIIARWNFCKAIQILGTRRSVIIGKPHNVEVCRYMTDHLSAALHKMAREAHKASDGSTPFVRFYNAFWKGALSVINQRLREQHEASTAASAASTALVVQSNGQLEAAVTRLMPGAHTRATPRPTSQDGYLAGQEAGRRVPLHAGIGSRGTQGRIA